MAYTLPSEGLIRPWTYSKNRYIHRRATMVIGTPTTGIASAEVKIPCPGRLIAVQYGIYDGASYTAATAGALTLKADTTNGVQIWTDGDISSVPANDVPLPLGTTAKDEGNAATDALDAVSGGLPIRGGAFLNISGGAAGDGEVVTVDMYFRLCTYACVYMRTDSGADGSGISARTLRLGNSGVLSAIALDYQNQPSTTDLTIQADNADGYVIFLNTSSLTDVAPTLLGRPGGDEGIAATAVTDGTECGNAFRNGLYLSYAQGDAYTSSNEQIVVEMWIDD